MKIKKLLLAAAAALMLCAPAALADDITVEVNGVKINSDVPAMVLNDRTVVPVRAISEALNCDIAWDGDTKGVNIYRDNTLYMMWIDKPTAFKLSPVSIEDWYDMDMPPVVINDRTLLPLRALGELLGASVSWDQASLTASVTLNADMTEENSGYAEQLMNYEKLMFGMYDAYDAYVRGEARVKNVIITMRDGREIELELYPDIAPESVANFEKLANEGFYDGLIFHRVIDGFMIQGGGFNESGTQQPAETITGEFISNGYPNFIKHERGVVSMARAEDPNSASSQFFIVQEDSPHLNGSYAAFGKVISGMYIIDDIASAQTDASDRPVENIVIESIAVY